MLTILILKDLNNLQINKCFFSFSFDYVEFKKTNLIVKNYTYDYGIDGVCEQIYFGLCKNIEQINDFEYCEFKQINLIDCIGSLSIQAKKEMNHIIAYVKANCEKLQLEQLIK